MAIVSGMAATQNLSRKAQEAQGVQEAQEAQEAQEGLEGLETRDVCHLHRRNTWWKR